MNQLAVIEAPTRTDVMRMAASKLSLNDYGLPTGLYRTDLLPHTFDPDEGLSQDILSAAYQEINYDEGFPTVNYGEPLWHQMDFEPHEAYLCFEAYKIQGTGGVRQLLAMLESVTLKGDGCLEILPPGITVEGLQTYFYLYYWEHRSRAFDLFNVIAARKQRALRALNIEDDHFLKAEKILNTVMMYFDEEEELLENLTPKAATDLLKWVVQWQRMSVGIPANGPSTQGTSSAAYGNADQNPIQDIEVTLKQIVGERFIGRDIDSVHDSQSLRDTLLSDPETAQVAQELVLRLSVRADRVEREKALSKEY